MNVLMDHILPTYRNAVLLQWSLQDPDPSRTAGLTFTVQRSGSPYGDWTDVATGLETVYYADELHDGTDDATEVNLLSLNRELWYRVLAVLSDGDVLASYPMDLEGSTPTRTAVVPPLGVVSESTDTNPLPETLFHQRSGVNRRLQLVQRAVLRRAIISLRNYTGIRLAVLKKRHSGTRCTRCMEPITKTVVVSDCSSCYGTGWVGGYYPAFVTLGRIIEADPQIQLETAGETEIVRANIDLINFPRLERHDILVEMDSDRRWRVNMSHNAKLRRRKITQQAICTELARTSVAYGVSVETSVQTPILNVGDIL